MASWRDTTDHDPGDESDGLSDFEYAFADCPRCPFCDDDYKFAAAYCTPVFRYGYKGHKTIVDVINTCDAKSCLRIAGDLAAKWEQRLKERIR